MLEISPQFRTFRSHRYQQDYICICSALVDQLRDSSICSPEISDHVVVTITGKFNNYKSANSRWYK